MAKSRFTKAHPKKEGYYWVKGKIEDEPVIMWFIPNGLCHATDVASHLYSFLMSWDGLVDDGCTRSVRAITL